MASLTGLKLDQVVFNSSTLHPPNQIELAPAYIYIVSSALGQSCMSGSKTAAVKPTFIIPCDQNVGSLISFSYASHFDQVLNYGEPKNEISVIDMHHAPRRSVWQHPGSIDPVDVDYHDGVFVR